MTQNETNPTPTATETNPNAPIPRAQRPAEPLIFEKHTPGSIGVDLPPLDVPAANLPDTLTESAPNLPELGQLDVVRHYTRLSQRNFSVDGNFYPLGSCTMKYNPRINEAAASMPGIAAAHPLQADETVQGLLAILYELRQDLAEIAGLDDCSLQPCAGAHGEWTALKVIRAYFNDPTAGNAPQRRTVLAPDTAHGTNFASCAMCGANVVPIKSKDGLVDLDQLRANVNDQTAALMITNPNTAGLFDGQIGDIADILHKAGALLYLDGANMNAILGIARPGDFGVDIMHYNTHKTFSTPHGCGGPGAGPIAVRDFLTPYLPTPQVEQSTNADGSHTYHLNHNLPKSIGKVRSFFGQVGVLVRAWTYIRAAGPEGLRNISETAVLAANYLAAKLDHRYAKPYFDPAAKRYCAHEFITVPQPLLDRGVTLIDIAKRMIDYNVHPPTMHWPVHDCLMIEPTETESLDTLDRFIATMHAIADEAEQDTTLLANAPTDSTIQRADEVAAARSPVITHRS